MKNASGVIMLIAALLLSLTATRASAAPLGSTFSVDSTGDENDDNPGSGFCHTTLNTCTLRAAMTEANALPGLDKIHFNIGGSGIPIIKPNSQLPWITDPVKIDGTTQCASPPCIVLNGTNAPGSQGFLITAGGSTIKGLVINRFTQNGILIETNGSNVIKGNYIGTDETGTIAHGNEAGVLICCGSSGNTIGGTTADARNVISGNLGDGVQLDGESGGAHDNVVEGNYIGTDATGTSALGNGTVGSGSGVTLSSAASNNTIGGTDASARNVISGNTRDGVAFYDSGTTGNTVEGNYIGTDVTGTKSLGNNDDGVYIAYSASKNTIGGTTDGAGNIIAYNGGNGVTVGFDNTDLATGNKIRRNSIHENGGLGIDLGDDGVTLNDSGDGDTGPNNLQNFPKLLSADSATLTITGEIHSTANTKIKIEFFSGFNCDPSGYGEGKNYLGKKKVTTDGSGDASYTFTATNSFNAGDSIKATATGSGGNTSEFSKCVTAS